MTRTSKRVALSVSAIVVVVTLVSLLGYRRWTRLEAADQRSAEVAPASWPKVLTAPVERRDVADTLEVYGRAAPRQSVTLAAELAEPVSHVFVTVGDWVRAGEALVVLEDRALSAEADAAAARVRGANSEARYLTRDASAKRRLWEENPGVDNLITRDDVEAAERARDVAQAAHERAQADLARTVDRFRRTVVRAPFTGIVAAVIAEPGDRPGIGGALVTLVDLATLEIHVDLAASDLAALAPGVPVPSIVVSETGAVLPGGRVESVAPDVDAVSALYAVTLVVANPGVAPPSTWTVVDAADSGWSESRYFAHVRAVALSLAFDDDDARAAWLATEREPARHARPSAPRRLVRGGQTVRVALPRPSFLNALVVPQSALVVRRRETFVYRIQHRDVAVDVFGGIEDVPVDEAERLPVRVVAFVGEDWAILEEPSPLGPGDIVIVAGQQDVTPGGSVVVTPK